MAVPCGNGVVDNGEDCDEGVNNGLAGGRCNSYCQFVCAVDANCDDSTETPTLNVLDFSCFLQKLAAGCP